MAKRATLRVETNAHATRILFEGQERPSARVRQGTKQNVKANSRPREVTYLWRVPEAPQL